MTRHPLSAGRFLTLLASVAIFSTWTVPIVRANGEVGTVAPDFTITNLLAGPTSVTLSQYAGSVVVLAFFAEW